MTCILTTHAGSLPRPRELDRLWIARSRGEAVDASALDDLVETATAAIVARQVELGLDIVNDGEQPRESFFTFVRDRMTGFSGTSHRQIMRDITEYPTFLELMAPHLTREAVSLMRAPACEATVQSLGTAAVDHDIARLRRLGADYPGVELFMTSPSPGIVAAAMENRHYPTLDEYIAAVGEALSVDYHRIAASGLVLQIDAPDLALERHCLFADRPLEEFVGFVDTVVAAINRALVGIDPDRVRLHVCWGNYEGPHDLDVPFEAIVESVSAARVGGLVLSLANPRHAHEVTLLGRLPRHWSVVVGVVDTTSNYVEHPETVADRLERAAGVLGDPARVLAGTDCGFATSAGLGAVASEVVWPKLAALVEGARLASSRLA